MRKRKICVISGSRADYGHIKTLMTEIQKDSALTLQLIVTGMNLSAKHGAFYKIIEKDGFRIHKRLGILRYTDDEVGVTKALGLACQLFADAYKNLSPDIVVLLGDRYEMLAAAIAAYFMKIPIAHIAGGECTEGSIDEGVRHSITKMASVHFTTTETYRKRVIQLGEHPKRVFNLGAPGLDLLHAMKIMTLEEWRKEFRLGSNKQTAICTYHPVTLRKENPKKDIETLLEAIQRFSLNVIFTQANADPFGNVINKRLREFCRNKSGQYVFVSNLGMFRYYSCLKYCDLMIGNSSSGLVEAPSYCLPVVNIGERQQNRIRGKNVIDVKCSETDIVRGIKKALSAQFKSGIKRIKNPYDRYHDGKTSFRIKEKLKKIDRNEELIIKKFYDL